MGRKELIKGRNKRSNYVGSGLGNNPKIDIGRTTKCKVGKRWSGRKN